MNIWDRLLTDQEIKAISGCQHFPKGNVLAWEKSIMKISKANISEIENPIFLCDKRKRLAIFPIKVSLDKAKNL